MHYLKRKSKIVETYSLIFIDLISILIAYALAVSLRFSNDLHYAWTVRVHYDVLMLLIAFCLLYSILVDWNRGFFARGKFIEAKAVFKYDAAMLLFTVCALYLTQSGALYSRMIFMYFAIGNAIITYLFHNLFKTYMLRFYRYSVNSNKVMVVAQQDNVQEIIERLRHDKAWNYEITSIALMDDVEASGEIAGIPVVANADTLFEVATQIPLDEVFIDLPRTQITKIAQIVKDFETMGVVCHYNVEIPELNLSGKMAGKFGGYAVMTFSVQQLDYRRMLIKRGFDIMGGLVGTIILAIVTPFVGLAIKLDSPGPIFFGQTRIGRNGRRFKMYKFRSMYIDAEERKNELMAENEVSGLMFKMENDPRITKVGRFIRKTSIDEIPQFLSILMGSMSLIGTRPPTEDEFEQYDVYYRRRLSITPGLTGMWQVSGRSDIKDFDDVVKLDLEYIDNWSLGLDIKILFQTVGVVLFGRGSK